MASFDLVITQPAGTYQLHTLDVSVTSSASWIEAPENVPFVYINDDADAPAVGTLFGGAIATSMWFALPPGSDTKIGLVLNSQPQSTTPGIQFYDVAGAALTTTFTYPNLWTCPVTSTGSWQAFKLTGLDGRNNLSIPNFINCPPRFAPSQYQILIP